MISAKIRYAKKIKDVARNLHSINEPLYQVVFNNISLALCSQVPLMGPRIGVALSIDELSIKKSIKMMLRFCWVKLKMPCKLINCGAVKITRQSTQNLILERINYDRGYILKLLF